MYDYDVYELIAGVAVYAATLRAPSRDAATQMWMEGRPAHPFRVMPGRIVRVRFPL